MKITWTETHTIEIDNAWIKEVVSENAPEDVKGIIADNMCEVMYEVDRTNVYEYINNWNEIIDSIYQQGN